MHSSGLEWSQTLDPSISSDSLFCHIRLFFENFHLELDQPILQNVTQLAKFLSLPFACGRAKLLKTKSFLVVLVHLSLKTANPLVFDLFSVRILHLHSMYFYVGLFWWIFWQIFYNFFWHFFWRVFWRVFWPFFCPIFLTNFLTNCLAIFFDEFISNRG